MGELLISFVTYTNLPRVVLTALHSRVFMSCIKVPWLPRSVYNHISDGWGAASPYSEIND